MGKTLKLATLLSLAAVITAGCATNRSEVQLSVPLATTAQVSAPKGVSVVIRSVKDERLFETAPSDPSIPSLGFEGSANATQELKSRAIARKRNTFGKALGDVVLQEGRTVPGIIRETLTTAFEQAGYKVPPAAEAGSSPLFVDVRITRFWAWMTPGFWALTFEARIETDLEIQGKDSVVSIKSYANDSRQLGTDSAWIDIVSKGLQEYQAQAAARLSALLP